MSILVNQAMTSDGTRLVSRSRHDFVQHKYEDGSTCFIDGGLDYVRAGGVGLTLTTITTDNTIEEIREVFEWGSYGEDGLSGLKWIKLKDIEDDHIKAILTLPYLSEPMRIMFKREQSFRSLSVHP